MFPFCVKLTFFSYSTPYAHYSLGCRYIEKWPCFQVRRRWKAFGFYLLLSVLYEEHIVKEKRIMFFISFCSFLSFFLPLSPAIFKTRYQIVVEIVQATTISNIPQVKRQKGKILFC